MEILNRYPADVIRDISPRDHMYWSGPGEYFTAGRMSLDVIRLGMVAARKRVATSILDLPSGHGRVLRMLKAEYPKARLAACDVDHDAVDFCAEKFGAVPIYSHQDPLKIEVGGSFDLIWCGSLLTHLDEPLWDPFLRLFEESLEVGGVLVMTVSGSGIADILRHPVAGENYIRPAARRAAILENYASKGFGYADYPGEVTIKQPWLPQSYGISLAQASFVCRLLEMRSRLRLLAYTEAAWLSQDVISCVRVA